MEQYPPPEPDKAETKTPEQKKPPSPPLKKKVKKPPRIPTKKKSPPPIKKKGRGKIWVGSILIIIGIISVILLYGMSFLPLLGGLLVLLGVYYLYKGFTDVDKVLIPETKKVGKKTKTKMVYKKKKTLNKGAIFLIVVFIFFSLPIFLTIFQFGNFTTQPYSIYNEGDGGCSILKEDIQSMGYETTAIISGYAEITKFPEDYPLNHTLLIIIGPKALFFPTGVVYLQQLLDAGGAVVILQDEGTANEGLMFLGFFSLMNLAFGGNFYVNPMDLPFQNGYLCQGAGGPGAAALYISLSLGGPSYNVRFWTAAPLLGGTSGFMTLDYTDPAVWLDLNKNLQQDPGETTIPGGYPVSAVSMGGDLYLISDPDIFTNKLMLEGGNDNRAFASAMVNTITSGDTSWKIIFDEAHQVKMGHSGSFYFGLIIGIEDFLLLSWLFAPLGPYLAFKITKKFIPEAEKPEKAKLSTIKREGISLYTRRLDWFKRKRRYEKALILLYRRLKRSLTKILGIKGFDVDEVIDRILANYPEGQVDEIDFIRLGKIVKIDEKRLVEAFKTFEAVEKGRRVEYQAEFLKIFLEMKWVSNLNIKK